MKRKGIKKLEENQFGVSVYLACVLGRMEERITSL